MKANIKLNLEFSWTQGIYWAANGLIFNFAAVFLHYKGYTNYELGIILALGNVAAFIAQPLVAGYIDKRNKQPLLWCSAAILIISMLLAAAAVFVSEAGAALSAVYILILAANILIQPLVNSISTYLSSWGYNVGFAKGRAVGSLCFALCMVLMGILTQRISPVMVPVVYILLMALLAAVVFLMIFQEKSLRITPPAVFTDNKKSANTIGVFIRENKRFCVYLLGVAMLFFSHSLLCNFMIEFIRPIGGDSRDMGNIFCTMALCELPAMLLFDRLLRCVRCSSLLKFSAIMFAVKQAIAWYASSLPMMYAAICLQGLSFAVFIPAAVRYVDEIITKRDSVKGQAFTTSMITLGSVFASYLGGYMLDNISVHSTLMAGTLVSVFGVILVLAAVVKTDLKQ